MISDFLNRKKIIAHANQCVEKYFDEKELNKINSSDTKKAEKRLKSLTSQ